MRASDLKKVLKTEPFEPVRIALSDGRSVIINHPVQVIITDRHLCVGLARLERTPPLATPKTGDAIAKDMIWVNLLHVTTVELLKNGRGAKSGRRRKA